MICSLHSPRARLLADGRHFVSWLNSPGWKFKLVYRNLTANKQPRISLSSLHNFFLKKNWRCIIYYIILVLNLIINSDLRVWVTFCSRSFLSPSLKEGGSHSWSRSTFMNSSIVRSLVGVSSNSLSLSIRAQKGVSGKRWRGDTLSEPSVDETVCDVEWQVFVGQNGWS